MNHDPVSTLLGIIVVIGMAIVAVIVRYEWRKGRAEALAALEDEEYARQAATEADVEELARRHPRPANAPPLEPGMSEVTAPGGEKVLPAQPSAMDLWRPKKPATVRGTRAAEIKARPKGQCRYCDDRAVCVRPYVAMRPALDKVLGWFGLTQIDRWHIEGVGPNAIGPREVCQAHHDSVAAAWEMESRKRLAEHGETAANQSLRVLELQRVGIDALMCTTHDQMMRAEEPAPKGRGT